MDGPLDLDDHLDEPLKAFFQLMVIYTHLEDHIEEPLEMLLRRRQTMPLVAPPATRAYRLPHMPALIRTYLSTKHSSSSAAAKLSGRVDGFALSQIKPSCMQPGRFNPRDPTLSNMSCLRSPFQEATTKLRSRRQCCYRDPSCWLGGTILQVRPCSP
jgi:hypothetical protein